MDFSEFNSFTVMVAGNSPKKIIGKYNAGKKGKKHVVYEFSKAEEYRTKKIAVYEELLKSDKLGQAERDYFEAEVEDWKGMSASDFYLELTAGYDLDEDGNAVSDKNDDGKFVSFHNANKLAIPFQLKNSTKTFSARKGDIDWSKIHLSDKWAYEVAWETVVEGRKPNGEKETEIFNNMIRWKHYLTSCFKNKEDYIRSNTSYWCYAFVSEELGWNELTYDTPQFQWVTEFYDRFIAPLPDDTLLTIYECVKS